MDGLKDWLDAVHTAGIPCAVVSSIERRCLVEALNRMGLTKYFQVIFLLVHYWGFTYISLPNHCLIKIIYITVYYLCFHVFTMTAVPDLKCSYFKLGSPLIQRDYGFIQKNFSKRDILIQGYIFNKRRKVLSSISKKLDVVGVYVCGEYMCKCR